MTKKRILFIGGSVNQTSMGHQVVKHLQQDFDCVFTPYYCDGILKWAAERGWLDFTVIGGQMRRQTEAYLEQHDLPVDYGGQQNDYDLVVSGSDLLVQRNVRGKRYVLIQEGMTDPENLMYHLVRWFRLPRFLASTSTNGLSNAYQRFCVASEGYRDLFIRKGADPSKIIVTGIPNFDNAVQYLDNDFPYYHHALVATSDARETLKWDNRKRFIRRALDIADGRPVLFKLHPNEDLERARREIKALAPQAIVLETGNVNHMIANCDVLITQYSSVVYIGLALGKEVHSYFDREQLKRLQPIQNGGSSARKIAQVCREVLLQ